MPRVYETHRFAKVALVVERGDVGGV